MFDGLKVLLSRIGGLVAGRSVDREFEQELETHVEMLTEENIRRGMAPGEARRAARLRLGGMSGLRETNHEMRGLPLVETFFQDVRYALRMLRKSPGFAVVAVLTLALGIGVNAAIFSIVNDVLLRPLPVRDPGQIVVLANQRHAGRLAGFFSYPNYHDIRDESSAAFSDLAAYRTSFDGLSRNGRSERIFTNYVTGNFFTMLGVRPALGRLILPSEGDVHRTDPVIVLGYAYWQSRFAGDPGIVGRKVSLDGNPVTVVGVTAKGFHGVFSFMETQAYLPMSMALVNGAQFSNALLTNRAGGPLLLLGRLRANATLSQAQSVLGVIARRLANDHPRSDPDFSLSAFPQTLARPYPVLHNPIIRIAAFFLALALLVLVLACVNVANLLLVRAGSRARELAVRAALGGSRARLTRQLLTESLLLALLGGAGGILLGMWTCAAVGSLKFSTDLPVRLDFHFDWRVFLYGFAAAAFTGVLVGIVPALRASRVAPGALLHEGGRSLTPGRQRLRSALVIAQVAGSLMLLVIATLFARSLERVQQIHLGFDPSHIVNLSMDPHEVGYSDAQARQFYQELLRRARSLPGVRSAVLAFNIPMRGYTNSETFIDVQGYTPPPGRPKPLVSLNAVSPGYFRTLRIPLVSGRVFTEADNQKARHVAVINQAMARRFWPHENPVGRKFRLSGDKQWAEIVGVVHDSRMKKLTGPVAPYFFFPFAQRFFSYATLQVRTAGPPAAMIPQLQNLIVGMAPGLPVFDMSTMNEALNSGAFLLFRFGAVLAAALGLLGLILALVGVYGVTSYAAGQRTQEIGIRLALGARPWQILRMIFGQGAWVVGIGLAIGLAGAFGAARLAGSVLLVSPTDPLTFVAVPLALAAVALFACYVPARRAMRVEPTQALRYE